MASFARPSTSALTPIMRGYANLGEIPYDPDKARALLKAAGYPNGFTTKIATTPRYPMGVELAEAVAADLKKVGIAATIEVFDWATMVQFWAGLPPEKNPQEIFIMGAGASTADADWGLRPIFRTRAHQREQLRLLLERRVRPGDRGGDARDRRGQAPGALHGARRRSSTSKTPAPSGCSTRSTAWRRARPSPACARWPLGVVTFERAAVTGS